MVLPMIPLSTIAAAIAMPSTVNGLSYDSDYARDVWFGNVPTAIGTRALQAMPIRRTMITVSFTATTTMPPI